MQKGSKQPTKVGAFFAWNGGWGLNAFWLASTFAFARCYLQGILTLKTMSAVNIIPKETIPSLRFPHQAVPLSAEEHRDIMEKLAWATRLGNAEHGKCRIHFKDDEGVKAVETTIWAFDNDHIVLKYGMTIPVGRVLAIEVP